MDESTEVQAVYIRPEPCAMLLLQAYYHVGNNFMLYQLRLMGPVHKVEKLDLNPEPKP